MPRDRRYGEKLATPDITIADLIGEVDPIKVAEGRYLSDELTIHYGLLPRTNRGIFAINELPDLAERIQVGLLNIMEERDVQIRGYKVRLPLDLYVVASANPEDYTNRGRIITPLKDRFGSQIRTHYPRDDRARDRDHGGRSAPPSPTTGFRLTCPAYMKQIVAELTHLARALARHQPALRRHRCASRSATTRTCSRMRSSARSGSTRDEAVPRVSDLGALVASTGGKIELETLGDGARRRSSCALVQKRGAERLQSPLRRRRAGRGGEGASRAASRCRRPTAMPSERVHYARWRRCRRCRPPVRKLGRERPGQRGRRGRVRPGGAAPDEKLNKDAQAGRFRYRAEPCRSSATRAGTAPSSIDLDADDLLEAMSDDLLSDGDPWSALRRLFQQGARRARGRGCRA